MLTILLIFTIILALSFVFGVIKKILKLIFGSSVILTLLVVGIVMCAVFG